MTRPKVLNYAPHRLTMARLQKGFTTGGIGFRGQFAQQQFEIANVRFGSITDIEVS